MEKFKIYNLDDSSKRGLSDLAKKTFDAFLEQGLMVHDFSKTSLNLKFNTLKPDQRKETVDGLLELLKNKNDFSKEEEDYLKDRLEFLSSGKIAEA